MNEVLEISAEVESFVDSYLRISSPFQKAGGQPSNE
jgi:hypothetical protein